MSFGTWLGIAGLVLWYHLARWLVRAVVLMIAASRITGAIRRKREAGGSVQGVDRGFPDR